MSPVDPTKKPSAVARMSITLGAYARWLVDRAIEKHAHNRSRAIEYAIVKTYGRKSDTFLADQKDGES